MTEVGIPIIHSHWLVTITGYDRNHGKQRFVSVPLKLHAFTTPIDWFSSPEVQNRPDLNNVCLIGYWPINPMQYDKLKGETA